MDYLALGELMIEADAMCRVFCLCVNETHFTRTMFRYNPVLGSIELELPFPWISLD
jgi:hypothetical protein